MINLNIAYRNNLYKLTGIFLLIGITLISAVPCLWAQSPFTSEDVLKVNSIRNLAITNDGQLIAGIISNTTDRLNVDHKQFGNPTYISPRKGDLVIIDTETMGQYSVFNKKEQINTLTWSNDGKILAFFLLKGDQYYLTTYDSETKKIKEIKLKTEKAIASNSFIRWTPNDKEIILALREEGWVKKSVLMFEEATVGPIIVYDSQEPFLKWDKIRNMSSLQLIVKADLKSGQVWELMEEGSYNDIRIGNDGNYITCIRNFPLKTDYTRRGGTEYEMIMVNLEDTSKTVLWEKEEKRINITWNENNDMYAWADSGYIFLRAVFEEEAVNLTKEKNLVTEDDSSKIKLSMNRWSPDGTKLLVSSDEAYWLIDHQTRDIEKIYDFPEDKEKSPDMRISAWSPDGRYLYFSYSEKDTWNRGYTRYEIQTKQMKDLIIDSNLYSGLRMSKNGEKFFYNFSDGDKPNDLFKTDKDFISRTRVTDLNPWIKNKKLTKSELIKYLDTDGNELYGILYYPVDYQPDIKYPLVCEIYERFFSNGYRSSMNLIANAGFFGFRPSVNLETGYPGEAWIKGVTSGINKLIERGIVDPDKLGVHGTSYGGYATSLLITQTNRFAAAINISGKVNIVSFLGDSPRIGTRNYAAAEVGQDRIGETLWEAPMKYYLHTAVSFADRINTPHLLLTGEGDWNVPAMNTRELYYAMRRLGKEVVWVNYFNGGHGAGAASNESEYHDHWNRIINWYKTNFEKSDEEDDEESR